MMVVDPNYHPTYKLTPRQIQILADVAEGHTYTSIAHDYHLKQRTVVNVMVQVRKRLGAVSTANAVHIAHRHNLLR
jgi:DNA-binding NarL/FixJ family response regulator